MIWTLFIGLWCGLVALGSTYAGAYWQQYKSQAPAEAAHAGKTEVRKVKPISVPVISDGVLKGYVSVEFGFVFEKGDAHGGSEMDPEGFLMDEAFRLIYSDAKINFAKLDRVDLETLTRQITERVNARMGSNRIKETLIKNITFVPKEDIPH